ncbi:transketolase [Pontiella agarivorans]|uniref:Transketolase n=1 Tax=Pontiella agarivorans TaxID=3038953 RepID=A0ABU5MT28_9BACT|nr:transketolase [Pontiella agarivorans]MDZ8117355.1 transketolase [Pontiella agarivorans]
MDLKLTANTIRGLAMDGVQAAKSGHPGMPMGMADVAAVLWAKYLKYNPVNPDWPDRDRFILSAGHGSMLHYSLLHLAGYDLPIEELKNFRQFGSKTAGHPEYGHTVGVETTTGPLGQGVTNGVGMAIAEKMLEARYNSAERKIVDHFTYVIASEGEFEEGVSHEAFSLAGNHGIGKLIVFYDQNFISIEGDTHITYTDDVTKRMEAYHWQVLEVDGHNHDEIAAAIEAAQAETEKPTVIICNTKIGYGSPNKEGGHECHGAPLGEEEILLTKKNLGMPEDKFYVPAEVYEGFKAVARKNAETEALWNAAFAQFAQTDPEKALEWDIAQKGELPDLKEVLPEFEKGSSLATRSASGKTINAIAKKMPFLVGGSADLAPSNNTYMADMGDIGKDAFDGRNFHFGVRELAMGAIMNGVQLHGGFRIFGGTFLVFADYVRPAARLAALMGLPVIYVFTHDSFCVGEDGPTHQPIETCASLRMIPNMTVIRPADPTETAMAWVAALENKSGPTALLLTRQNLPVIDRDEYPAADNLKKGAYTLWQSGEGDPDLLMIATGSEVEITLAAAEKLGGEGANVRVVSMPSWELFEKQDQDYQDSVLPPACVKRVAVEAGTSFGWERYVNRCGVMITKDDFGASGPFKVLQKEFGFTAENVYEKAKVLLG